MIDPSGRISQQQDVVIYRRDYHPVFIVSGIHHFMAKAVVAVIQCRSQVAARQALKSALKNVVSAKRLDRTDGGRNYVVVGGGRGPAVNPRHHAHQIFGAIITERSLSNPDDILTTWQSHLADEPRGNWPNMYVDVHRLTVHYMTVEANGAMVDPNRAEYLAWSASGDSPPLVLLAQHLMSFLRIAPVIDFHPERYFPPSQYGPGRMVHLTPDAPHHSEKE